MIDLMKAEREYFAQFAGDETVVERKVRRAGKYNEWVIRNLERGQDIRLKGRNGDVEVWLDGEYRRNQFAFAKAAKHLYQANLVDYETITEPGYDFVAVLKAEAKA